jgi:CRP-like cAMP-binding protein/predicted double-glycine peptidase
MAESLLRRTSGRNGAAQLLASELPIFSFFPADVVSLVMDSFEPRSFSFGHTILREGERPDALYVVTSGRARILRLAERGEEISLQTLRPGDTFGDAGLDGDAVATATVRASSDLEVLRLDRSVLRALLKRQPALREYLTLQARHRELRGFFREYIAFAKLPDEALQLLLSELETVTVPPDTVVARQGEMAQKLFIVEDGRLRVHSVQDGRGRDVLYLRRGDYFGDASLFSGEPQAASIVSVGECRLLALGHPTFMRLVDGYPDFGDELRQRVAQLHYRRTARIPLDFVQELLPADARSTPQPMAAQVDIDQTATYATVVAAPASRSSHAAPKMTAIDRPTGRRRQKRRRFRTFPHVRQVDETDCGSACLAMICRHFGRKVSQARIRQLTHTSLDGTSLRDICHAATELGLAARTVKASPESLDTMPLPAIVHWEGNHWVVLYDIDERHARIADPATRLIKLARAEFETRWSGFAALFDYTQAIERVPETKAGVAWLTPFFRPYARIALQALGLAVVVSALQMILPLFTQVIVDRVLVDRDVGLLTLLIIAMGVALVVMTAAMSVQRYLLSFMAVRIDSATLDFLTRTLLALPTRYFTARRTGDIQRRLAGVRQVREFVVQNGLAGITAVTQLVASVALMLIYSPPSSSSARLRCTPCSCVPHAAGSDRRTTPWNRRSAATPRIRSTRSKGSRPSRRCPPRTRSVS